MDISGDEGRDEALFGAREMALLRAELERLGAGDLARPVETARYRGAWAELAGRVEALRTLISGFAAELQVTADQVASAVDQMQGAVTRADELGQILAELQAAGASVGEVMQRLTGAVNDGGQALAQANQALRSVRASAGDTGRSVRETAGKLDRLGETVGHIDGILARIAEISDRTRLLSFNATIEAARAGEHGRGFAVVAQEVKKLADQSSLAVEETARVTRTIKEEIAQVVEAVSGSQENIYAAVTGAAQEVEASLDMTRETMARIVEESREAQREIDAYFTRAAKHLEGWAAALEELRRTADLLQHVGQALTAAVGRVAADGAAATAKGDEAVLAAIVGELQRLAASPEIIGLDPAAHARVLRDFLASRPELEAVYSNGAGGGFIFSEPPAGLANARLRQWWREAMAGRVYRSPVYISAITRRPCRTVAVPIIGVGGRPAGVLGADLRL